jgi:predicted membrane-bound spermidine synthase
MKTGVDLDRVPTAEGELVLRRYGDREYTISIAGRVIMSTRATESEKELAEIALRRARALPEPCVAVAGLGLGYTLRAALDLLPPAARVLVVELTPAVVTWCRGPLAEAAGRVLDDPRVTAEVGDVFAALRRRPAAFDAIALDLWCGPLERRDPVFTAAALAACRAALRPGGRLTVWSEQAVGGFERRLLDAGFVAPEKHVARRGFRHVNYSADVPMAGDVRRPTPRRDGPPPPAAPAAPRDREDRDFRDDRRNKQPPRSDRRPPRR